MFLRDIKCEADDRLFSLNLKQDLAVAILLVSNINFLRVWLVHFFDILGDDRRLTRKYSNYEAPRSTRKVLVLCKGNTDERHTLKPCTTTTSVGHRHVGALNNFGKTKICKKHQTFGAT